MDTGVKRKMKADDPVDHIGRLRKSVKTRAELCCPVCCVTLWPGTVEQHYQQERAKLTSTSISLAHSKKRLASDHDTQEGKADNSCKKLVQETQQLLESVKRRHILFRQYATPLHSDAGPSNSTSTCPVCDTPLPADQEVARSHVNECLGVEEEGSSGSETYDEYTWCNVTRVRATSMLSPEARANMFDGTIVSQGDNSTEAIVDVEDDETKTYGPVQYSERDTGLRGRGMEEKEGESGAVLERDSACDEIVEDMKVNYAQHCLICMDSYHRPLVSIQCWHVYCEECWLQALAAKKVCPKCKQITSHSDLRKIFI